MSKPKQAKESSIFRFDFTGHFDQSIKVFSDSADFAIVKKQLNALCKNWVFQVERGEKGRLHLQGRVSLRDRKRFTTLKSLEEYKSFGGVKLHWSPTHVEKNDFDYVMKPETRVEGPFDERKCKSVLRELEGKELLRWQNSLVDLLTTYDERVIDLIVEPKGAIGKSWMAKYLSYNKIAFRIPPVNDESKIMGFVVDAVKNHAAQSSAFVIDLPRAFEHKKMADFFSALEQIKSGFAYEWRYQSQYIDFENPRVVIFTNTLPPASLLSLDRWNIWTVRGGELVRVPLRMPSKITPSHVFLADAFNDMRYHDESFDANAIETPQDTVPQTDLGEIPFVVEEVMPCVDYVPPAGVVSLLAPLKRGKGRPRKIKSVA